MSKEYFITLHIPYKAAGSRFVEAKAQMLIDVVDAVLPEEPAPPWYEIEEDDGRPTGEGYDHVARI